MHSLQASNLPDTLAKQGCQQCPRACCTFKINFKVNRCNTHFGKPTDDHENRSQRLLNYTQPATAKSCSSPVHLRLFRQVAEVLFEAIRWVEIIYQDFPAATRAVTDDFCTRKRTHRKLQCHTHTENYSCHQSSY